MTLLYLMHVDWNWIKQRPHYIAEILEKKTHYSVIVLYRKSYPRKNLVDNECSLQNKPIQIFRFPFSRFMVVFRINTLIESFVISKYIKKADILYITSPTFYPSIKHTKNKKIIYDCMDDALAFPHQSEKGKKIVSNYEKALIERAYLTIFSAKNLQTTVKKRIDFSFNAIVLNNAMSLPETSETPSDELKNIFIKKDKKIVTYIGTVAEWFDYDLLVTIAETNKSVVFYIFGPMNRQFPAKEGIIFFGPQRHEDLFFIMNESDVLIMPFQVNDLIKSVNPVKLYEYIFSGKPVISVRYDETALFEEYVYLYESSDNDSLLYVFAELEKNNFASKKTLSESREFALANTWEKRVEKLSRYI